MGKFNWNNVIGGMTGVMEAKNKARDDAEEERREILKEQIKARGKVSLKDAIAMQILKKPEDKRTPKENQFIDSHIYGIDPQKQVKLINRKTGELEDVGSVDDGTIIKDKETPDEDKPVNYTQSELKKIRGKAFIKYLDSMYEEVAEGEGFLDYAGPWATSRAEVIRRLRKGKPIDTDGDGKLDAGKTLKRLGKSKKDFIDWTTETYPELASQLFPEQVLDKPRASKTSPETVLDK